MTDMNQLIEMQQALTFFGTIGGLALALLGFTSSFSFV